MTLAKIALRNLARQKRRTFLLGGALVFGIIIVIMINGLAGGAIRNMEENLAKMVSGHLLILSTYREDGSKRLYYQMKQDSLAKLDKVFENFPFPVIEKQRISMIFDPASIIFNTNSTMEGIEGIDLENSKMIKDLNIVHGALFYDSNINAVIISQKLADKLGVHINEDIFIQTTTIYGQNTLETYSVKAIYKAESSEISSPVLMGRKALNRLMGMSPDSFTFYSIYLSRFEDTDKATLYLVKALEEQQFPLLSQAEVENKELREYIDLLSKKKGNGPFGIVTNIHYQAHKMKMMISTINWIALIVLIFILGIILIGVANAYRIIIQDRIREIGSLRALGMQRYQVKRMILYEILALATCSLIIGFLIALFSLIILSLIPFEPTDIFSLFFYKNHLSWQLDWIILSVVSFMVILFTWLAGYFPARRASKIEPATAMR